MANVTNQEMYVHVINSIWGNSVGGNTPENINQDVITVVDKVYNEIVICSAQMAWMVVSPVEIFVKSIVYGGIVKTIAEFFDAILNASDLSDIDRNDPTAAFNIWITAVRGYGFLGCISVAAARWKSILAMALAGIYSAEAEGKPAVAGIACPVC